MDDVFVLLDDCHATAQQPRSRLYTGFVHEHRCTDPATLDALWQQVERDQADGLHAAVLADYEWGCKLQQAGLAALPANDQSALRVLMFQSLQLMSCSAVDAWLQQQDGGATPSPAGVCGLQADIPNARFDADIARIRERIRQGETYQVNYTLRLHGQQYGPPLALYRRLRAMQPVAFGALAALPPSPSGAAHTQWVVSASPELFVSHQQGRMTARPMKGTASRQADAAADAGQAAWLQHDAKNRAENVMIVDLLRNDLGRISETGSVRVPHLFAVESYKTVHQMTSTVESRLRSGVGFAEVLRALFPCGSITGAPKLHTMDCIAELEARPRGLYCGAIGWVDAPAAGQACGDFCLSVAIRTLELGTAHQGMRSLTLGVGSGVVLDSRAQDEFAEVHAKARFLTRMDPGFTLFETLRIDHGRVRHLRWHLQRLRNSASTLGFALDEAAVLQRVQEHVAALPRDACHRLRLDLHHDGRIAVQHTALTPLPPGPARLLLARAPLPAAESLLLAHKTSLRSTYDAAIQQAMARGAFDAVFVNARGEVCEGARSTLLVQLPQGWATPPLSSGVLQGVLRARLLQRFPGLVEKTLTVQEVLSAPALLVCSALRGIQRAEWLRDATGQAAGL